MGLCLVSLMVWFFFVFFCCLYGVDYLESFASFYEDARSFAFSNFLNRFII